jgi:hypothetical protein
MSVELVMMPWASILVATDAIMIQVKQEYTVQTVQTHSSKKSSNTSGIEFFKAIIVLLLSTNEMGQRPCAHLWPQERPYVDCSY